MSLLNDIRDENKIGKCTYMPTSYVEPRLLVIDRRHFNGFHGLLHHFEIVIVWWLVTPQEFLLIELVVTERGSACWYSSVRYREINTMRDHEPVATGDKRRGKQAKGRPNVKRENVQN